jgi:transcription elongation GreA/GreB family factor
MSRAFVKEPDLNLPPLDGPVLLTPQGLVQLEARLADAQAAAQQLKDETSPDGKLAYFRAMRELRLLEQQRHAAQVIDPAQHPEQKGTVAFGARVAVEDEDGKRHVYRMVGSSEADPAHGQINVASPLAKALLGQRVGETVTWRRPAGDTQLTVVAIDYPSD